jgi:hypothetical protein
MRSNDPHQWSDLLVERGASPVPLEDAEFRRWMAGRRVFVSSTMDDQMRPDREAARALLARWEADPVMWETVTPRDEHPERAYLEGVERSALFALLLGARYGVADATGYAPTHKEGNRAKELGIPRLLFVRGDVSDRDRDGKLNDWLRTLYSELSGAQYASPTELAALLEARLRETAAQQESLWIKLGPLVFPGQVSVRRSNRGAEYVITARVRDGQVRRALLELGSPFTRVRADRLTFGVQSRPVHVDEVRTEVTRTSESAVTIICTEPGDRGGAYHGFGGVMGVTHVSAGGRRYGPADQLEGWAAVAVLGHRSATTQQRGFDLEAMFTHHDGPTLPETLRTQEARGWLAEGLARLFLVEHVVATRGGHFDQLEVGPAVATGVRLDARVSVADGERPAVIAGSVPLR